MTKITWEHLFSRLNKLDISISNLFYRKYRIKTADNKISHCYNIVYILVYFNKIDKYSFIYVPIKYNLFFTTDLYKYGFVITELIKKRKPTEKQSKILDENRTCTNKMIMFNYISYNAIDFIVYFEDQNDKVYTCSNIEKKLLSNTGEVISKQVTIKGFDDDNIEDKVFVDVEKDSSIKTRQFDINQIQFSIIEFKNIYLFEITKLFSSNQEKNILRFEKLYSQYYFDIAFEKINKTTNEILKMLGNKKRSVNSVEVYNRLNLLNKVKFSLKEYEKRPKNLILT